MKTKTNKGFTLTEILVFMAILSIFTGILTNILISVFDIKLQTESLSSVQQDGQYLIARLTYDIQHASTINTPNALGQTTSSLSLTINGDTYSYMVNNGKLQLTNSNGTDNLNSFNTNISNLQITRLGVSLTSKNSLHIGFTLTSKITPNSGAETLPFQTTIGIR